MNANEQNNSKSNCDSVIMFMMLYVDHVCTRYRSNSDMKLWLNQNMIRNHELMIFDRINLYISLSTIMKEEIVAFDRI